MSAHLWKGDEASTNLLGEGATATALADRCCRTHSGDSNPLTIGRREGLAPTTVHEDDGTVAPSALPCGMSQIPCPVGVASECVRVSFVNDSIIEQQDDVKHQTESKSHIPSLHLLNPAVANNS